MFDPVSNPFAIQNLLDREEPPFIAARDERPGTDFGIDPLTGARIIKAFEVDRGLQLPDDDFAVDASMAGEFAAQDAMTEAGFEAEPEVDIYAAFTAGLDDESEASAGTLSATEETAELAVSVATDESPDVDAAIDTGIEAATETVEAATASEDDVADGIEAEAETPVAAAAEPESLGESEPLAPAQPDLSSEAVMQLVEAERADAFAQGLEAGRAEGRDAERPLAHRAGYDEGFAAGVEQARAESQSEEQRRQQQEHQAKLEQLQAVIDSLQQLAYNPDAMFEPMKRLAVHLAEQLVRGELAQSPQAISRLVDNALRELNASGDKAVVVHLNPEDLEAYRPTVANFADSLILRPDTTLERGSVRVSLDGSVVEDLMQRRVDGLKKSIAQAPASGWRAGGGGSLVSRVQQGQPVDDVTIVDKGDKAPIEAAAPADGHA